MPTKPSDVTIWARALDASKLTMGAKVIGGAVFARYAQGDAHQLYASLDTMAELAGCSRDTARRAVAALVKGQWVIVTAEPTPTSPGEYRLQLPPETGSKKQPQRGSKMQPPQGSQNATSRGSKMRPGGVAKCNPSTERTSELPLKGGHPDGAAPLATPQADEPVSVFAADKRSGLTLFEAALKREKEQKDASRRNLPATDADKPPPATRAAHHESPQMAEWHATMDAAREARDAKLTDRLDRQRQRGSRLKANAR
jgi:hypothetical protein